MKIPWWGWYLITVTILLLSILQGRFENQKRREARLESIRSICHTKAIKDAEESYKRKRTGGMPFDMYFKDDYESYYRDCLRSYGIEK